MVGWLDGWMVGWLDGWMVGWLDGWMVGWLDMYSPWQFCRKITYLGHILLCQLVLDVRWR